MRSCVSRLDALRRRSRSGTSRPMSPTASHSTARYPCDGTAITTTSASCTGDREIRGGPERFGQDDAGKVRRVLVRTGDGVDELGVATPEHGGRVIADDRGDGRAPRPSADHRNRRRRVHVGSLGWVTVGRTRCRDPDPRVRAREGPPRGGARPGRARRARPTTRRAGRDRGCRAPGRSSCRPTTTSDAGPTHAATLGHRRSRERSTSAAAGSCLVRDARLQRVSWSRTATFRSRTTFAGVASATDRSRSSRWCRAIVTTARRCSAFPREVDFKFAYGPGSFRRHAAEARQRGLAVRVVRDRDLAFDVDSPTTSHAEARSLT